MKNKKLAENPCNRPFSGELNSEVLLSNLSAEEKSDSISPKRKRKTAQDLKHSENFRSGLKRKILTTSEEEVSLRIGSSTKVTKRKTAKSKDAKGKRSEDSPQVVEQTVEAKPEEEQNVELHEADERKLKEKRKTKQ